MSITNTAATTTATTAEIIIETCWSNIETFADLESTISLLQTCRSLHKLLIATATTQSGYNKVKVAHFQIVNLPPPDNFNNSNIDIPRNYTTAHIRIPHYISHALNNIHFPTLQTLHIDFPLTKKRCEIITGDITYDYIEDAHTSAFPIFVTQLAYATNLTRLHLNINRLLQYEKHGCLEALYEIFGINLSRCSCLEEMSVVNTGSVKGLNFPMYSDGLANALLPTLQRRRETLRKFSYQVIGQPSSNHYRRSTMINNDVKPTTNAKVFRAVLQLVKLEQLCIHCSLDPFCDFASVVAAVAAGRSSNEKKQQTSISHLTLICETEERKVSTVQPIGPLMDYFSSCQLLQHIHLELPPDYWGKPETLKALTNLIINKPKLSRLDLNCSESHDVDGNISKWLAAIVTKLTESGVVNSFLFSVKGLSNVDYKQFSNFQESVTVRVKIGPYCMLSFFW